MIHESRPIPGFPGYHVTTEGDVISWRTGSPCRLAPHEDKYGYLHVSLHLDGRRNPKGRLVPKRLAIHRAVLLAYRGAPPPTAHVQCRHLDGNKHNNSLGNLEWGTAKENTVDRFAHGWRQDGFYNPNNKLSPESIKEVRELRESGLSQDSIAAKTGISQTHVSRILNGAVWAWVP